MTGKEVLNVLRKIFSGSSITRRIMMLAGSTALAQLIGISAMPVITRLYTPEQIGVVSLFLSFFAFWAPTLSMRYEYALLIADSDAESHVIKHLAISLVFLMSLIGAPLLWGMQIFELLKFSILPPWAPLIALPIFMGHGIFMVYRSWALRAGLVPQITKATIVRSSVNAISKIGLGATGLGTPGLFIAELAAACASMWRLAITTVHYYARSKPASISRKTLTATGKKFSKFPLLETPSAWLDALALALPLPLVATLYGAEAAGWFGLARMVVSVPNSQVGGAVADVFQMELARSVLDGNRRGARRLFFSIMRKTALLGLLPLAASVIFLPWIMPLIFGAAWEPAGLAAAALAPWFYAALVVSPLSRALSVLQAQEMKFIYDISAVVLIFFTFYISKQLSLSFIEFCLALSTAQVLGYTIYSVVLIKTINSRVSHTTDKG